MNVLLAMLPAFFWGTTYAVTKFSLPDWPPLLLGALRALPAGLILLAIKPTRPEKKDWPILFSLGLINIATFFGLIFVMALTLPSAISGVGMVSVPVFAMFFHWTTKGTRPTRTQLVSGISLIAMAWVLFDPTNLTLNPIGLFAMLAAIICIILGSTITKTLGLRIPWWTVLTWQLVIGGSILSIAAAGQALVQPELYQAVVSNIELRNVVGLGWVILLNTAFAYAMYVWLLQRMTVVEFTFGSITNPVAGILSGMILLGESFTPLQYSMMLGMITMSLMPQFTYIIMNRRVKHSRASAS
jgi:drug/metabolite transporter (DMT)-like permease